MDERENVIEFISGDKFACVTFTSKRYINRIKKLYETKPEEFSYLIENADGSVCARIPTKWVKVSPPKQMTDEQREKAGERLKKLREESKREGE